MLKVALTGGIATGKTHVLRRFASLGVPTIDADRLAREAVRPGTPGHAAVVARFGDGVLAAGGDIDRQKLGAIVFAGAEARRALEAIIHPYVEREVTAWLDRVAREGARPFAIADIPLLFEVGKADRYDKVIVAMCSAELQVRRLMERDGMSEADAQQRLAAQWPIEDKARHADYVIDTNGTIAETDRQVDFVYRELRKTAAEETKNEERKT